MLRLANLMPKAAEHDEHHPAGRHLRLRFVGGSTPRLNSIEFQWKGGVKGAPWKRVPDKTNEKSPSLDAKLPKALADFFVAFAAWAAGDRGTAFSYSETSKAETIRNARDSEKQHAHKVFVRDDAHSCYKSIFAGEGLSRPKKVRKKSYLPQAAPKPVTLWVIDDVLPAKCVEIFWDNYGQTALSDETQLNELLLCLRGLSPDTNAPKTAQGEPKSAKHCKNNLPYPSNPHFRGRENRMKRLHLMLSSNGCAVLSQSVTVSGQGGIGKTQLAVQYAWEYARFYTAILWVPAENPRIFRSSLAALASPTALDLRISATAREEDRLAEVIRWLKDHRRWLLICDNADSPEAAKAVRTQLPPALSGSILVTSRLAEWPATISVERLDVLAEGDAVAFLLERSGRTRSEEAEARYAARLLGFFPLALEQAAGWVLATNQTWHNYCQRLRNNLSSALSDHGSGGVDYGKTVMTTWEINFQELNELSRMLLNCMALLSGEPIPEALFAEEQDVLGASLKVEASLADLAKYCLVTRSEGHLIVHRLTQYVVRESLAKNGRRKCLINLLRLMRHYCPSDGADSRTWGIWDGVLPHVLAVISNCESDVLRSAEVVKLIQTAALFIQTRHRPDEAIELLSVAEALAAGDFPGSIHEAKAKNAFGGGLWQVGRMESQAGNPKSALNYFLRAEGLLRRSAAIAETADPHGFEFLALVYNNLGNVLRDLGVLAEAEIHLRRALTMDLESRGRLHPKVAIRRNNLGILLQQRAMFGEAEAEFLQALEITRAALGDDDPTMIIRHHSLGRLYLETSRTTEAEEHLRRAVELATVCLEENHPNRRRAIQSLQELRTLLNRSGKRVGRRK